MSGEGKKDSEAPASKNSKPEFVAPSRVSLADLLAQAPSSGEWRNKQNAHRVLAITSVARVDDALHRLLVATLAPTASDQDDLLDEGKILGSLGLRAKLCMRMRLISPTLYGLIKDLARIRNDCAHRHEDFNVFEDQSTQDIIDNHWRRMNPNIFDRKITSTEERFKMICSYIDSYVSILVNEAQGGVLINNELLFANKVV